LASGFISFITLPPFITVLTTFLKLLEELDELLEEDDDELDEAEADAEADAEAFGFSILNKKALLKRNAMQMTIAKQLIIFIYLISIKIITI
jgi:hypothetical protein